MRSVLKVLPLVGAGSLLLAHILTASAFRRRTDAMIACLEHETAADQSIPPVPNTVWLSQRGEMRANLRDPWRPFTAEQVISIHQPGFA